jgi:hypothetical protein
MTPVKELALVEQPSAAIQLFERLATDPNASVEKIERLMALWERGEAKQAEKAFFAAMAEAQKEMRPVREDATNPQTRSRYATYEALDRALRPIYTKHGFGMTFNTAECPTPECVRVVCKVVHTAGHSEGYQIDMPADGKGAKGGDVMTKTHATGSGTSYGMRYLLKMIWNVATGEGDDDGNGAAGRQAPQAPDGFEVWWDDLQTVAEDGLTALKGAWDASKQEFKSYLTKTNLRAWEVLKVRAAKVGAK